MFKRLIGFVIGMAMLISCVGANCVFAEDNEVVVWGTDEYTLNYQPSSSDTPKLQIFAGSHASNDMGKVAPKSIKAKTGDACPSDGIVFTYKFNISEAGYYKLTTNIGDIDHNYVSQTEISIDDGDYTLITSAMVNKINEPYKNNGSLIKNYETNLMYNLTVGEHTIKIKMLACRDASRKSTVFGFFEKAVFAPVSMSDLPSEFEILGSTAASGQSETITAKTRFDTNNFNDNVLQVKSTDDVIPEGGLYIEYTFNTVIEGDYFLTFRGGAYDTPYLSKYSIQVDDEIIPITSKVVASETAVTALNMQTIELKNKFRLTPGQHKVRFIVTSLKDNGRVWQYIEYIRFEYDEAVGNVDIEPIYAEAGQETQATAKLYGAVTGRTMHNERYDINYTGTGDAISVTEDGKITAKALGKGKVSVSVGDSGMTAEADVNVTVNGLYCTNVQYFGNNKKITSLNKDITTVTAQADIFNCTEETKSAVVVLGFYKDGALVKYSVEEYNSLQSGQNQVTVNLTGLECDENTTVQMYVFDSMNKLNPIVSANEI